MKTVRSILAVLALSASFCSSSQAAIDPAKAADIRQILRVTGSEANVMAALPTLARSFANMVKASKPDLPDAATSVIEKELSAVFSENLAAPGGLLERLEPVYDAAFTHEEIKELLVFYATPIGKKLIASQPVIVAKSAEIGQRWGQSLGPLLQERIGAALKREGLIK